MANRTQPSGALAGLKVVELGEGVVPAFCGKWLAAFGAHVTKVEPPRGDWTRRFSPIVGEVPDPERGPLFLYLNTGKKGIVLDLSSSDDQATARELIACADILVHPFSSERLSDLGLDLRALRRRNPGLVEVALLPFGSDGPYADFVATPAVLLALGGYQYLTGEPGREPLALPGFQPDYLTGLFGVIAGLAGVLNREKRGHGCSIEVSGLEVMASLHQFTLSQYLYQGTIRSRHGNRWENLYPITMLPCRDGYVGMSLPNQEMWERLCLMMDRPDLLSDPRFASPASRHANADALDELLVAWLRGWGKMEFFHRAQEEWRLPVGPLYALREVLEDPQYAARGYWVPIDDGTGVLYYPGMPVAMSATPWSMGRSPRLGEHTVEVREWLTSHAPEGGTGQRTALDNGHESAEEAGPGLLLDGVRVLDFTRVWSGPLCARILADLGAEVIRIEPPFARPAQGAQRREAVSQRGGISQLKLNRNKLGVSLDLQHPRGREIARQLAAMADVIVENFTARVMPQFGLDYPSLRAVNPRLVMLSMPGFGSTGPYRDYTAYGPAIEPMTGLCSLLGYPGGPPLNSAIAYPDAVAGVTAACAILVALVHQRRTGVGQWIDLSQMEATTSLLGEYFLAYQMRGEEPERLGNGHPQWAPCGTYRCAGEDEWVTIAVRDDAEWAALCRAIGLERWLAEPAYATASGRRARRAELDRLISAWTQKRSKSAVMETLQRAGVPAGAVLNGKDLWEDPQLRARGFFVEARADDGQTFPMPGTPIVINGQRRAVWSAAPKLGEHNRRVLCDVLGLSMDEVRGLEKAGVLGGGVGAAT